MRITIGKYLEIIMDKDEVDIVIIEQIIKVFQQYEENKYRVFK